MIYAPTEDLNCILAYVLLMMATVTRKLNSYST